MDRATSRIEPVDVEEHLAASAAAHDEIARRAYRLWIERGFRDGRDLDDWVDAEQQLMAEREALAVSEVLDESADDSLSAVDSENEPASRRPRVVRRRVGPDLASK